MVETSCSRVSKALRKELRDTTTLNVGDSIVESPEDFSLSQIWLPLGLYITSDINTTEAGWQVYYYVI